MRSSFRPLAVAAVLTAPWIAVACGQAASMSSTTTGASSSTGSGGRGASSSASTGAQGGASSSASTGSTGSTGGAGSTSGTGGQADAGGGTGGQADAGTGGSGGAASMDGGDASNPACGTTVTQYPVDPSPHITQCTYVQYSSNPPTSGPHYPIWAAFQTYTKPVPQGFYVHDLEHGAIVVTYNCPTGCDAELAQLAAYLETRPADSLCEVPVKSRIVVTPDPHLTVRFAASAWGWALRSQCFDLAALAPFMDAHYGNGPEILCNEGEDVTDPANGIPADCDTPGFDGG